jgi:hypothetical protein
MDIRVIFVLLIFFVIYGFNTLDLVLPKYKRVKYIISAAFAVIGCIGWLLVWVRVGWLITGIVSSAFLILSGLSLFIAFILDLIAHIKSKES